MLCWKAAYVHARGLAASSQLVEGEASCASVRVPATLSYRPAKGPAMSLRLVHQHWIVRRLSHALWQHSSPAPPFHPVSTHHGLLCEYCPRPHRGGGQRDRKGPHTVSESCLLPPTGHSFITESFLFSSLAASFSVQNSPSAAVRYPEKRRQPPPTASVTARI